MEALNAGKVTLYIFPAYSFLLPESNGTVMLSAWPTKDHVMLGILRGKLRELMGFFLVTESLLSVLRVLYRPFSPKYHGELRHSSCV